MFADLKNGLGGEELSLIQVLQTDLDDAMKFYTPLIPDEK